MQRIATCTLLVSTLAAVVSGAARGEDLEQRIERMEHEIEELKTELRQQREAEQRATPPAPTPQALAVATPAGPAAELLDRVRIGGYGSLRFEHSSLDDVKNTFTLRRFVLTTDANVAPRLRAYAEVEFERFRKLELEKTNRVVNGGLSTTHAVEGTDDSEISLEQAWLQYDLQDWLRFRGGAILVPIGRFNMLHDDNRWDLPRRSLVDRGVPVLPVEAAWDELGVGFNGDLAFTDTVLGNYQLYVVNGVTLDTNLEQVAAARPGDTTAHETEVEVEPNNGTFNLDSKDAKALTGRFGLSPSIGSEIAGSFYWGRYTPDFLPNEDVYALSGDGILPVGPFEVEGEYVFTHFGGIERIARGLATVALNTESAIENNVLEDEVDFELANLASDKQGYWLDLRYRFWPQFLSTTVLGSPFPHPQLIATVRGEQVWLGGLIRDAEFSAGQVTQLVHQNRHVDRITTGLAYRPVPLVVFQLAYEYTLTDANQSLADVTNFLPARAREDHVHALLAGMAFGF